MGLNPPGAANCTNTEISGFVLAGGRSSRLGQDKVLLRWNGITLLDHAVGRLQQVCKSVQVCADRDDLAAYQPLILDALPGTGPLGGIVAALEQSQTEWNLLLAVDLPLVPVEFLRSLVVRTPNNFAACILPLIERVPQPLCGLYHRSLAHGLRLAMQEGKFKITYAIREATRQLPNRSESRLELWDVEEFALPANRHPALSATDWFLNLNTAEDWRRAQALNSRIPSPFT